MRPGRLIAVLLLAAVAGGAPAAPALAQTDGSGNPTSLPPDAQAALNALLAGTSPQSSTPSSSGSSGGSVPQADGGGAVNPSATSPAPDDQPAPDAEAPLTTSPATAATGGAGSVPGPPAYLTAGQDAAIQPISSVARVTDPDVPLEPVRLASLIALLLAALGLIAAVVLRALGVRTAAPVAPTPALAAKGADGGLLTRARERSGLLLDDVRDFLRRSR